MMEFLVFHDEEFDSPSMMFFYSMFTIFTAIYIQLTNVAMILNDKTAEDVIAHFVEFKILLQVQDYYLKVRENLNVKKAAADGLTITRDYGKVFGTNHNHKKKDKNHGDKEEELLKEEKECTEEHKVDWKRNYKAICGLYLWKFISFLYENYLFYFFPFTIIVFPIWDLNGSYCDFDVV